MRCNLPVDRRHLITLLGGAAATWPVAARGQRATTTPVVGFLNIRSSNDSPHLVAAFHRGLAEVGYVEGQNVRIEYRWAQGQPDRLPALAAELARHNVAVMFASGNVTATAAKALAANIPIVFISSIDPVDLGFVASLNRPGGNMTGISQLTTGLVGKQLEILHQVVPGVPAVAVLVNPTNQNAEPFLRDARAAARALGWEVHVLRASADRDFDSAFVTLLELRNAPLLISEDAFFTGRSAQLAALAARHAVPAMFVYREFAARGGLLTYGPSIVDAYRQCGIYSGKILKGTKPADIPVQQPTRFELVINLKAASALGLNLPPTLLALTDEVIE
jgi:putative ABC transport system substrate-binding protein